MGFDDGFVGDDVMEVGGAPAVEIGELRLLVEPGGEGAEFLEQSIVGLVAGFFVAAGFEFGEEGVAVAQGRDAGLQELFVERAALVQFREPGGDLFAAAGVFQEIGAALLALEDDGGVGAVAACGAIGGDIEAGAEFGHGDFAGGDAVAVELGPSEREALEFTVAFGFGGGHRAD